VARADAPRPAPVAASPVADKAVRQQLYAADVGAVRDAEERLLPEFEALPPRDLLARMIKGPDRKSFNLMLIALENGIRSERRGEYEESLVWAMERTSGNGIKLEGVAGLAARLGVSGPRAAAAARLLMKVDLESAGAEALGELAWRGDRDTRDDVRRHARERSLAATLGCLVEDESHVRELAAMLSAGRRARRRSGRWRGRTSGRRIPRGGRRSRRSSAGDAFFIDWRRFNATMTA